MDPVGGGCALPAGWPALVVPRRPYRAWCRRAAGDSFSPGAAVLNQRGAVGPGNGVCAQMPCARSLAVQCLIGTDGRFGSSIQDVLQRTSRGKR